MSKDRRRQADADRRDAGLSRGGEEIAAKLVVVAGQTPASRSSNNGKLPPVREYTATVDTNTSKSTSLIRLPMRCKAAGTESPKRICWAACLNSPASGSMP